MVAVGSKKPMDELLGEADACGAVPPMGQCGVSGALMAPQAPWAHVAPGAPRGTKASMVSITCRVVVLGFGPSDTEMFGSFVARVLLHTWQGPLKARCWETEQWSSLPLLGPLLPTATNLCSEVKVLLPELCILNILFMYFLLSIKMGFKCINCSTVTPDLWRKGTTIKILVSLCSGFQAKIML